MQNQKNEAYLFQKFFSCHAILQLYSYSFTDYE